MSIPPRRPARTATNQWIELGISIIKPTYRAKNIPIVYCPEAPMLKSPILNANPTAKPVIKIGVAKYKTSPTLPNPPNKILLNPPNVFSGEAINKTKSPNNRPNAMASNVAKKEAEPLVFVRPLSFANRLAKEKFLNMSYLLFSVSLRTSHIKT